MTARFSPDPPLAAAESWPARKAPSVAYDVVAINIKTKERRTLAENKTEEAAEAIIKMAVIRRGVDDEFYHAVPRKNAYDRACQAIEAEARATARAAIKMRARAYALRPRELDAICEGFSTLWPQSLIIVLKDMKVNSPRYFGFGGEIPTINLKAAMLYARYARAKAYHPRYEPPQTYRSSRTLRPRQGVPDGGDDMTREEACAATWDDLRAAQHAEITALLAESCDHVLASHRCLSESLAALVAAAKDAADLLDGQAGTIDKTYAVEKLRAAIAKAEELAKTALALALFIVMPPRQQDRILRIFDLTKGAFSDVRQAFVQAVMDECEDIEMEMLLAQSVRGTA